MKKTILTGYVLFSERTRRVIFVNIVIFLVSNHSLISVISGWISYKNLLMKLQEKHPGAAMDILSFSKYYSEIEDSIFLPKPSGSNMRDRDRESIDCILSSRIIFVVSLIHSGVGFSRSVFI